MRILATAALALGLTAGVAAAQTAATHSTTTHATTAATNGGTAMTASTSAHGNPAVKDPTVKTGMAPAAGANSFTEGQARDRIGKAGYARVSGLTKTADGLWSGKAMKGKKRVNVMLDFKGAVTAK